MWKGQNVVPTKFVERIWITTLDWCRISSSLWSRKFNFLPKTTTHCRGGEVPWRVLRTVSHWISMACSCTTTLHPSWLPGCTCLGCWPLRHPHSRCVGMVDFIFGQDICRVHGKKIILKYLSAKVMKNLKLYILCSLIFNIARSIHFTWPKTVSHNLCGLWASLSKLIRAFQHT